MLCDEHEGLLGSRCSSYIISNLCILNKITCILVPYTIVIAYLLRMLVVVFDALGLDFDV